ncbi:MAG: CaiB/BaiF CoA-transferase family protein [Gammaproteobacteria bacterium]|nr:CaiB/BaiF CoA-transferase family protein [Gammaproteobacteria bacterium]MDE0364811.1 CaiB/BaiF CoA-transferase family protein [Gammaproteobacteria bacterium]
MAGPLHGVRVVDFTAMLSGPMAGAILADQGAEVIKVESPRGDEVRRMGRPRNGLTAGFFACNRGKRSLCLDLKHPEGLEAARTLIASADVVMQNFRPGAMDRLGLGAAKLLKAHPRLVYLSISGFGETGPYAHQRVYDPVIQALTGATDIQADRETGRPKMFRVVVADKVTALTAAQAVTAALFARETTGRGQHIRLAMLDALISFFWPEGMGGLVFVGDEVDVTKFQGTMDLIYETANGFITAGAVTDAEWRGMCNALDKREWIDDPRFKTTRMRMRNVEERKRLTAAEIRNWDRKEILARLNAEDVPSAPLLTRLELLDHEQVVANDIVGIYEFEGHGRIRLARPPARFEATPAGIDAPAPQLGEHSEAILTDIGYTDAAIRKLVEQGVVLK